MSEELDTGDVLLDRYRLQEVLGSGNFGETFAAEDFEAERRVAIKVLDLSRVDDWKAVELFEREAATLEQLDHERIPDYIDFVPVESDQSGYLVQTLAPGETLASIIERHGRFTEAQIRNIALQMLDILEYLASLNPPVVHRDIKPANILLDENENVYLVDFGSVQDAAERTMTGGSTVAGTFGYMAPEQLQGQATVRSDLFGLGMTLVHLAAGRPPSELGRSGLDVEFRPHTELSKPTEKFIQGLVWADPDERFESPSEAREHLVGQPQPATGADGGTLDADSLAELVEAKETAEEMRRRRELERIQKKRAGLKPRVSLRRDDDGLLLEVAPDHSFTSVILHAGPALFAFANPGFAIAGGFPFLGQFWPVFADNWIARWTIWGLFVFFVTTVIYFARKYPVRFRITKDGHFAIYHRNPDSHVAIGRTSDLSCHVDMPGSDEVYGDFHISDGEHTESFSLHAADLERVAEFENAFTDDPDEVSFRQIVKNAAEVVTEPHEAG